MTPDSNVLPISPRRRKSRETEASTGERPIVAPADDEVPVESAIAQRAYDLYQQRGCTDGHDLEDWLQAEREMRGHAGVDLSHVAI